MLPSWTIIVSSTHRLPEVDHSKVRSPVNEGRRTQLRGKIPPHIQSKDHYPLNRAYLTSLQPIPLEYLRLGSFDDPTDSRREKSEDAGILDRVRPTYKAVYPFTIYHASSKTTRRYTLYAPSDVMRKKWKYALADAITVRKVQQESNMVRVWRFWPNMRPHLFAFVSVACPA